MSKGVVSWSAAGELSSPVALMDDAPVNANVASTTPSTARARASGGHRGLMNARTRHARTLCGLWFRVGVAAAGERERVKGATGPGPGANC